MTQKVFCDNIWFLTSFLFSIHLPAVPVAGRYCFKAYYNMYGYHIGTLMLYVMTADGGNRTIWTKDNQQHEDGETWSQLRLSVNMGEGAKVTKNLITESVHQHG